MVSVRKLFEASNYAPPAVSPTAERDNYRQIMLKNLRKRIGKAGVTTKTLQPQINRYQNQERFDNGLGTTAY